MYGHLRLMALTAGATLFLVIMLVGCSDGANLSAPPPLISLPTANGSIAVGLDGGRICLTNQQLRFQSCTHRRPSRPLVQMSPFVSARDNVDVMYLYGQAPADASTVEFTPTAHVVIGGNGVFVGFIVGAGEVSPGEIGWRFLSRTGKPLVSGSDLH